MQAIASYDRTLSMRLYVHCTLFKYALSPAPCEV
jgi:hypothetical protein